MLICRACPRLINSLSIDGFFNHGSTQRLSSGRRPPGIHAVDQLKCGNLVAFSAHGGNEKLFGYIKKDLKYSHAALLPHLILNVSGMGMPYLNYYCHPAISVSMVSCVLLYPIMFLLPPRISHLSFNESSSLIRLETSFCQQKFEIPLKVCKFESNKPSLIVSGQAYKFTAGQFNATNLTLLKRHLRTTDYENDNRYTHTRFSLMLRELTSFTYLIILGISLACLIVHGFIFGYTDFMYSVINLFALYDEGKVMEKWKPFLK